MIERLFTQTYSPCYECDHGDNDNDNDDDNGDDDNYDDDSPGDEVVFARHEDVLLAKDVLLLLCLHYVLK